MTHFVCLVKKKKVNIDALATRQFSLIAEIVAFSTNTKMKCCYSTQFD